MAKTKVIWTATARENLETIGDYIAEDSPARAVDFSQRLFDSTVQLEDFPESGTECQEDPTCRQIVVEGYRIIYELSDEKIDVLAVISPGQDADRILPIQKKVRAKIK